MQQNNFENQVQQKLSNREIKPSANSWDRLDAMLSVEEKPKKKGFFWVNIAASFIVLASIGYYFYNQNEVLIPAKDDSIIVEIEKKNEIKNKESEIIEITVDEVLVENDSKSDKPYKVISQKTSNTSLVNNQRLAEVNQGVSVVDQLSENATIVSYEIKNQEVKVKNKYTSADKLLAELSNSSKDKSYVQFNKVGKSRISVSSVALLADAQKDIDKTFKATILKKLNKNYQELTIAIANRNYEE
jgi:hypothetical protein